MRVGDRDDALAYHGGALTAARRLAPDAPEPWIDLSTGINPHPYPIPELPARLWTRLPEKETLRALESAAARRYGAEAPLVVAGPGSQALAQILARIAPAGEAAALAPTYGGFAEAFAGAGRRLSEAPTLEALSASQVAIVVNPNNPDGRVTRRSDLM